MKFQGPPQVLFLLLKAFSVSSLMGCPCPEFAKCISSSSVKNVSWGHPYTTSFNIRMVPYGSFIKEDGILEVGRVRMDSKIDKELE